MPRFSHGVHLCVCVCVRACVRVCAIECVPLLQNVPHANLAIQDACCCRGSLSPNLTLLQTKPPLLYYRPNPSSQPETLNRTRTIGIQGAWRRRGRGAEIPSFPSLLSRRPVGGRGRWKRRRERRRIHGRGWGRRGAGDGGRQRGRHDASDAHAPQACRRAGACSKVPVRANP